MAPGHGDDTQSGAVYSVAVTEVPDRLRRSVVTLLADYGLRLPDSFPSIIADSLAEAPAYELMDLLQKRGISSEVWRGGVPTNESTRGYGAQALIPLRAEGADTWVVVVEIGDKKIQVIKEVRTATLLGLKEAKDLVDAPPFTIGPVSRSEAEEYFGALSQAGATCELMQMDATSNRQLFDVVLQDPPAAAADELSEELAELIAHTNPLEGLAPGIPLVQDVNSYVAVRLQKLVEASGGTVSLIGRDR